MNITARLRELARISGAPRPVVSVYLNTHWADEHQRERVRVFLKNEIRKARGAWRHEGIDEDLNWVQAQGDLLIMQAMVPEANGVALFACQALGLREVLPVRVPFEDVLVVADTPFLRPLATVVEESPSILVVLVESKRARLIPVSPGGPRDEVVLESEVPGHHRRGGWAQLAQSRYQRHIQDHRGRHFDAVAAALVDLARANGVQRIVLGGVPRTVTAFQRHVPHEITGRIVGSIPGSWHELANAILSRAAELLARLEREEERAAVDAVLTEAAKSRQAVAALEETLDAVARGAVHRLYLVKGFMERGRVCDRCGALQRGPGVTCRLCGSQTKPAELGEAMVSRVIAAGGTVKTVEAHPGLARVGGVAALLRYPL